MLEVKKKIVYIFSLTTLLGSVIPVSADTYNRTYRLIGGEDVKIRDYPYLVYIKGRDHFCVGTIITAQFVLTSAECVKKYMHSAFFHFKISVGTDKTSEDKLTISLIETIYYHPNYKPGNNNSDSIVSNNVALIKHSKKFKLTPTTQSIEILNKDEKVISGTLATLIGWEGESATDQRLRKLNVPVYSRKDCNVLFEGKRKLKYDQICAGKINSRQGACLWDTGAPLVIKNQLVGVLSDYPESKVECEEKWFFKPAIYTSIAVHHEWIDEVTYENDYFKIIANITLFMLIMSPLLPCICCATFMLIYKKCFKKHSIRTTQSRGVHVS